jgi:hypothetical protein
LGCGGVDSGGVFAGSDWLGWSRGDPSTRLPYFGIIFSAVLLTDVSDKITGFVVDKEINTAPIHTKNRRRHFAGLWVLAAGLSQQKKI